jgi:hypothetical protein
MSRLIAILIVLWFAVFALAMASRRIPKNSPFFGLSKALWAFFWIVTAVGLVFGIPAFLELRQAWGVPVF